MPRSISTTAFQLLKNGEAPKVVLSENGEWDASERQNTVVVPKDKLGALKEGMKRAAREDACLEARKDGRKRPNLLERLELAITKWEIGRFIKEVARGQQE
ncbi:MAG: hypothetical protein WC263_02775 [Candidatus Micrarchaeia archaeon]|jgi:hypothetical protein